MQAKYCIRCGTALETQVYSDGHPHPVCPACGWAFFPDPKVAAAALVMEQNRVLLAQRHSDPLKGHWTLPAGFVNAEEDPAAAAVRECEEETGLRVENLGLHRVFTGRDHPRGADVVLVYRARILGGELAAHDDADDARFFDLTRLPPLAFRATIEVVNSLKESA